jgi:starvation-inducible DNA-binding protein
MPSWSAWLAPTRRSGDDGSNDLIVSQVVRANELQSWFIVQHLGLRAEQD